MTASGENTAAPTKASGRARRQIPYPVFLELTVGAMISLGLFAMARSLENMHLSQEFEATADNHREALQRNLDGALDAVYSVKAVIESQPTQQRAEFRTFTKGLLNRHPELVSVEWIPRVPGGERNEFVQRVRAGGFPEYEIKKAIGPGKYASAPEADEYFPVLYAEPLAENREALGYDPTTEPMRSAVMRRAAETGTASATDAVVLLRTRPDGRHPEAVMLFAPVIRSRTAEGTPSGDQEELAGYARVIVLLEQIVEAAWEGLLTGELGGRIVDAKDPSRRIYNFSEESHQGKERGEGSWEGAVRCADRSWKLELWPGAAWPNKEWGWWTRSVLGGGLTLTLLGAAYVRSVLRRREDKQLASEQLSTLASTAPGAMYAFRLRADGTSFFPYASPQFRELFGLDPKEIAADSKPAWSRVHPEDLGHLQATIAEAARSFSPWKEIFRVRHPAKGWIWIEGRSMPTKEPNGDILWHGFLIDVTERRIAEEKMRLERERLRRMVDTSQVGIVFLSPQGEVHEANDALLRMIGWTREEFAADGLNWRTLSPPEFWELDREATKEMLRRGSADPAERVLFRKDGSRIPVLCNGVKLPGERGEEIAVFVLDLTDMRRLEGALEDAGEAAQGRIARDLHDGLGQQLGGVLYLGRLLQQDLHKRRAPEAERAAEVNRLVKEALELTRNVARGLHPVPAQPDGLMLALQALIENATGRPRARLIFECQHAVLIDDNRVASQLYRIAQEALNNALKHSRGTRIEVALWQEPTALVLRVRDNGIGVVHGPAGHGLGMQSMNHRARLIGALLKTENAADGGAVITCRVPLPRSAGPTTTLGPADLGAVNDASTGITFARSTGTEAPEPIL